MTSRFGERVVPGPRRQTAAERNVAAVAGDRVDQQRERREVGREVHVHVADDIRRALQPRAAQRAAPAPAVEVDVAHLARVLRGAPFCHVQRTVGRAVVGDDDPPRVVREAVPKEPAQLVDAAGQRLLFVEDWG